MGTKRRDTNIEPSHNRHGEEHHGVRNPLPKVNRGGRPLPVLHRMGVWHSDRTVGKRQHTQRRTLSEQTAAVCTVETRRKVAIDTAKNNMVEEWQPETQGEPTHGLPSHMLWSGIRTPLPKRGAMLCTPTNVCGGSVVPQGITYPDRSERLTASLRYVNKRTTSRI